MIVSLSARHFVTCASTRMRHPEARRFFQPSEGSRAQHICTPRDALSVTNEHQGTVGDPRKIPRPAGECAGLRDDAHLLMSAREFGMTHTYWEERMRDPEARLVTVLPPECVIPKLGAFSSPRKIPRPAGECAGLRDDAHVQ